jgi:phospholipase/carboxylesterase
VPRLEIAAALAVVVLAGCDRHVDEPGSDPRTAPPPPPPVAAASAPAASARPPSQFGPPQELGGLRFLVLYFGGAHEGQKLPTVVALHGRGDTADNYAASLLGLRARMRVVVPNGFQPTEDHAFQWFDVDHSANRPPEVFDHGTVEAMPKVVAWLNELTKAVPMIGKPILTGFSQGGIIAHAIAVHHPELIEIAVPVAGFLPPALAPSEKHEGPHPRIVAFHGDVDPTVSYAWDEMSVKQEKAFGLPAELRLWPGVTHKFGSEELADYSNLIDDTARALEAREHTPPDDKK